MELSHAQPQEFDADADAEVDEAIERMRMRLYRRSSDRVICDLLADDLAQARGALGELGRYLDGLVEALGEGRLSPEALFDRAEDPGPLDEIDALAATLSNLRRRVAQVAGRERLSATSRCPPR